MYISYFLLLASSVSVLLGLGRHTSSRLGFNTICTLLMILLSAIFLAVGDIVIDHLSLNLYYLFMLVLSIYFLLNSHRISRLFYNLLCAIIMGLVAFLYSYFVRADYEFYYVFLSAILIILVSILTHDLRDILSVLPLTILIFESLYYVFIMGSQGVFRLGGGGFSYVMLITFYLGILLKVSIIEISNRRDISEH